MNAGEIIGLVVGSGVLLRIVEHFLMRKTHVGNVKKQTLENIDTAADTWQKIVDKLELQIEKLLEKTEKLCNENTNLKNEIYLLKEELASLKYLQKKTERYEKQINILREKVSHYELLLTSNGIEF